MLVTTEDIGQNSGGSCISSKTRLSSDPVPGIRAPLIVSSLLLYQEVAGSNLELRRGALGLGGPRQVAT